MSLRARRRTLGRRQALAAVGLSVGLGFLLSALHLAQDVRQEGERMAGVAEGVITLVEASAARAAYTYDQTLSETVVRSLMALGPVIRVTLSDNLGRTLAAGTAPPSAGRLRWITDALYGETLVYRRTLSAPLPPALAAESIDAPIGSLEITLDTRLLADDLLARSGWLVGLGLAKAAILAAALTAAFHLMVTRPLARLARDVSRIAPDDRRVQAVAVPPGHGGDELGSLAGAINRLLARFRRAAAERRALAEELARAERLSALGTLAGGVAHDFNNLLATISASTELALAQQPPDAPARPALERVLAAGRRGRQLVEQVMAFSRAERAPPTVIDLGAAAAQAVALVGATLDPRCPLRFDGPGAPTPVAAGEAQIHQLVANLCVNAAQACPDGGEIVVAVAVEGGHARLAVSDRGVGMDAAARRRAFEPFFTTKAVGEGTGLGLAVVYGVVKSLGGRVDLASAPGAGTVVAIRLPLAAAARGEGAAA